jgi:hypothetical protein
VLGWQLASSEPPVFYDAGESTVIYFDRSSGDTHLVSHYGARVLKALTKPLETEAVALAITDDGEQVDVDAVAALLDQLASSGLIIRTG